MQHDRQTYRGKDTLSGKWWYGDLDRSRHGSCFVIRTKSAMVGEGARLIDPTTVCQCIGLLDKNGTAIFESDIVLYCGKAPYIVRYGIYNKHHELTNCAPTFVLGWYLEAIGEDYTCELYAIDGYAARFPAHCAETEIGKQRLILEKIGNIHDNPELMEVKGGA